MRIKQIDRSSVEGDEVRVQVREHDDTRSSILMSADVVAELMSALFDANLRLMRAGAQRRAPTYQYVGCRSVTTETNQQALVLIVQPGFDIALTLTAEAAADLQSCIQQIQSDLKGGRVH